MHAEAKVHENVRVDLEDVARGVERDELGLRAHGVHCVVLQILYVGGVLSLTAKNEFQFFQERVLFLRKGQLYLNGKRASYGLIFFFLLFYELCCLLVLEGVLH